MKKRWRFPKCISVTVLCLLILVIGVLQINAGELQIPSGIDYDSPFDLAYSPDGKLLAVTNTTAARLDIIDIENSGALYEIPLQGEPSGVVWYEDQIFVAEYGAGSVAKIDGETYQVVQRFDTGMYPVDVGIAKNNLLVTDYDGAELLIIDLKTENVARLEVMANPYYLDVCPKERYVIVGHLTPGENLLGERVALSIIDLEDFSLSANVLLPYGSSNVRQIKISHDGEWAYVAHTLGKTNLPVTHITKGWVNTNAISVIDLPNMERYTTFLLDRISEGAANPWGLAISNDDHTLWVSASGVHQILKLDLEHLLTLILGEGPSFRDNAARNMLYRSKAEFERPYSDVWFKIKDDLANLELLQNDLGALWGAGLMDKIQLPGQGPRGIAISPDNTQLAVGSYYSGEVFIVDAETNNILQRISLGEEVAETSIRRGERLFHDATLAQQGWLSCATCHPAGGSDNLRWDLPGEQFGTPAATKALYSAYDNLGEDLEDGVRGAFWVEMITQPYDEDVEAISSFMKSLK